MNLQGTTRLTFYGAARTVTGSKYLIEHQQSKVLIDCGLFQGRKELRLKNWDNPPFEPSQIDAIVLSHAHIDHTGYLPLLVRRGFKGPVYCTEATRRLLNLLLPDSAHLQEEEANFANIHGTSKHKPAKPLYAAEDAEKALRLLKPISWNIETEICPEIRVKATHAGHILGAACLTFSIGSKRLTFSGDIGRYDVPILPDPAPVNLGDVLLCESTYGNRRHEISDIKKELAVIVNQAVDQGGPLIIPAFAVGRTQNVLYYLAELEREGTIPTLPVFVDSPMAIDATAIYRQFKFDFDDEALMLIRHGETPLLTEQTVFCRTVQESKNLNFLKKPRIVISASGMVTGGRILHHMRNWLPRPDTTVLFVGYQAEGTRGATIESGAESVKIFGEYVPIRATIKTLSGLSAHGDRDELVRWLKSSNGTPRIVRAVHGEPEAADAFCEALKSEFSWDARPAEYAEVVEF